MCHQIESDVIAIITIGNYPVLNIAKLIANSLNIPFISIKSDTNSGLLDSEINKFYDLNIHPSTNKLNNAVIDLILNYNWKKIIVLFDDATRVEDLIRFASSDEAYNNKITITFRTISSHVYLWQYLLKEVKKSGSIQIIVDLKPEMINDFLRIVIYI